MFVHLRRSKRLFQLLRRSIHSTSRDLSTPCLVSPAWLRETLAHSDRSAGVRVLNCTFSAQAEHMEQRIPGAKFFDINECSDKESDLPHMLPSASEFATYVSRLGVRKDSHVVTYDTTNDMFSSPRVWWMFRVMGHDRVSVLDGGFESWKRTDGPIESGSDNDLASEGTYSIHCLQPRLVRDLSFMKANIDKDGKDRVQVVDTRSHGRFTGSTPEPRPDLSSGRIPHSISAPYSELIDADTLQMKSPADLLAHFESKGIDLDQEIVTTCGSGVTACIGKLAIYHATGKEVPVYDGSWTEWCTHTPSDLHEVGDQ